MAVSSTGNGWLRQGIAVLLALAWMLTSVRAHEGPEHEIEELSELMAARGEAPHLLIDRAIEYAVLGRNAEAMRDLERALQLDPDSLDALRELARLQFVEGRNADAVATASRALRSSPENPVDRAGLLILRAEIQAAAGRLREALSDCQSALRLHAENPEWYLIRSELQRRLKKHRERLRGIEEGWKRTGAGLLKIERIDAQLDARRYREALEAIEEEMASSRIPGPWLIRRGRARLGLGDKDGGVEDLRAGTTAIDAMLDRDRPDVSLLLDQAVALVLLGEGGEARQVLALAEEKGRDPAMTARIREWVTRTRHEDSSSAATGRASERLAP
ncbi:MAG: tetratricopeptide repeat protein [Verrucomicrobiales bacterium]|nr:tetratricopeptide repeat protein [Verrucomicrobiales bacterium]